MSSSLELLTFFYFHFLYTKRIYICIIKETKDLLIDKLVKEEDNVSTEDKTEDESDDKTDDKPAGDNSNESPVTGESVVSVAAVAALIGAAFVFVRKSKKV